MAIKKRLLLLLGWFLVILIVLIAVLSNSEAIFVNGTIIFGWLLFIIQLTWNQSETFYLYFKKFWFLIKNPDCVWNMMVEYDLDLDETVFDKIDHIFNQHFSKIRIITLSNIRRIYKLDTLAIEVSIDENYNKLRLHIDNLEISFRRSREIIDNELGVLFESLSQKLKVDNSEYYFKIGFKEFNPYYGFFIRRLNAKDITTFNVKFNVENEKVTIGKKTMEIYTTSLQKLNVLSKQYLTLSPR